MKKIVILLFLLSSLMIKAQVPYLESRPFDFLQWINLNKKTSFPSPYKSGQMINYKDTLSYWNGSEWIRLPKIFNATTSQKGITLLSNSYSGTSEIKSTTEKALSDGILTVKYYNSGLLTEPSFTDNNNGTATIGSCDIKLYSTNDFSGVIQKYTLSQQTLTFTDGAEEYVCAKYNAGNPIIYKETNKFLINGSDIRLLFVCWRQGLVVHSVGRDSDGKGTTEQIVSRILNTNPYQLSSDGGLVLSETSSPTNRTLLVTPGIVYASQVPISVLAYNSSTDLLTLAVNTNGVWSYSNSLGVIDNVNYNPISGSTPIPSNKYAVRWFFRSIGDIKEVFYILGTGYYNSIAEATSEKFPVIPGLIRNHCLPLGRIIFQQGVANGVLTINDLGSVIQSSVVSDHNSLGGLQGGSIGQYYHLNSSQATVATQAASSTLDGYLSSTNWNTFNNKVSSQWTTSGSEIYYNTNNVGIGNSNPEALLDLGSAGSKLGVVRLAGSTSGNVSLQPNAVAGSNVILTLPSTSGTLVTGGGTASGTNTGDQDLTVLPVDMNRFGFLNQSETKISFDGINTFTLAPSLTTWSYYRSGIKYTITGSKTVTVASPMVDGTTYFIFIDATNGNLSSSTSAWTLNDTKVPVALLIWNNTLSPKYILADERHSVLIDRRTHLYDHSTKGTQFTSGGVVSGMVTNSSIAGDKTFGITATNIMDEDIQIQASALSDPDGATNTYYNVYRTSSTTWSWQISDMPFKYTGTNPYTYIEYDNGSGISTPSVNNRYVNTYIFVSNSVSNNEVISNVSTSGLRYYIIQGRGSYTTASAAYAENFSSFDMTGFPVKEGIALYQLTWQTINSASVKGQCQLNRLPVKISSNILSSTTTVTSDHNTLSGLQGGTIGEYYHLTSSQYTDNVYTDATQTLTNKTLTSPKINEDVVLSSTATKLNYLTSATGTTGTTSTNVVFSTSPSFTTSVLTGSSSFDVFNTTATTLNFGGAATTMTIGGTPTSAITHNYSTNTTATATTKTVNLGTGGASGSTTVLNMGSASGTTYSAIGGVYSSSYTLKVYGTIYATGAITSNSDMRTKNYVGKLGSVLNDIQKIDLIEFTFKKDKKGVKHIGYSAQNLNKLFPLISQYNSKDDVYELEHLGISAINTKAIQELIKENELLKSKIKVLEVEMYNIKDIMKRFELYKPTDSLPKSDKNQVILIYR